MVQQIIDLEPKRLVRGIRQGVRLCPTSTRLQRERRCWDAPADSVVALLFETDEFLYVMNVQGVSDRREVPVRVGGAMHSANRGPTTARSCEPRKADGRLSWLSA